MRVQACDGGEKLVEGMQVEFVGEDLGDDCCLLARFWRRDVVNYLQEDTLALEHPDTVQFAPTAGSESSCSSRDPPTGLDGLDYCLPAAAILGAPWSAARALSSGPGVAAAPTACSSQQSWSE